MLEPGVAPPTPGAGLMVWRGLTRACAVCGQRRLSRRWIVLERSCPRCGFAFERSPGHFVGAVGMNTIVTFGLMLVAIVAGILLTLPDVRFWPVTLVALGVALVVPVLFHVSAKTLWVAVDLVMNPLEPGEAPLLEGGVVAEEGSSQEG